MLRLLQRAGVTLKLRKCYFFQPPDDYLGHAVFPGTLQVAKATTKAIREARLPRNTELRSFLELCNFYRRFVPGLAKIVAPLNEMLKKGTPSVFEDLTDEQYEAYQELKDRLVSPPVLALPEANYSYFLDRDASKTQVRCVRLQEQDVA